MCGFSRTSRLVSKQDFQSVFAKPHKVSCNYLIALFIPNDSACARIGLVISKQRVKRAVDRNRIRRHIRESFRQQQGLLKGLDIIVLMRSEWSASNRELSQYSLRDDINKLWAMLLSKKTQVLRT